MKAAGKDLRKNLYADARQQLGDAWLPALRKRAKTKTETAVIVKGARVKVSTEGFSVTAATSTRALRGGLRPVEHWHAWEFGGRRRKATIRTRSPKGKPYTVTKTINRQLPGRVKDGRIAFDAASEIGTRLVASFVVSVVGTYRRLFGGNDG